MSMHQLQNPLGLEKKECDVQVEHLHRCISEVAILAHDNFKEAYSDEGIEYYPNWNELLKYVWGDKCVFISVRYEGVLVGYLIALLGPYKHNMHIEYADIESIYINKAFREIRLVGRVIKLLESEIEGRAEFILAGGPIGKSYELLYKFLKFKPVEVIYMKRLNNEKSTSSPAQPSNDATESAELRRGE